MVLVIVPIYPHIPVKPSSGKAPASPKEFSTEDVPINPEPAKDHPVEVSASQMSVSKVSIDTVRPFAVKCSNLD